MSKVLVPHGDSHMKFGIIQLEDGCLRSTTPCCGYVMFRGELNKVGIPKALCSKCRQNWLDLCIARGTGAFFEGWFGGYPSGHPEAGAYATTDVVIVNWIRKTLDNQDIQISWS